ncbi:hypothetical protein T09_11550 [Trichinella sp. T9]|nr:hypothetical protein T09_11550 [Trichinella sp. T9]
MKSRIIVLDKARLDSKKRLCLKVSVFLQFFKLEWLIYNVLCCVREVTFPKVSIQFLKKKFIYIFGFFKIAVFCQISCLQDVAVYVSFQKYSANYEEEMKDAESRISYFSCKPSATV